MTGPRRALARLSRVAREAAAQSRRVRLPEVAGSCTLDELAAARRGAWPWPSPGGPPPTLATTAVAVGPEGGWTPAELDAVPTTVGLGPHVLRAETAAVAAGVLIVALRAGGLRPGPGPVPR